MRSGISYAESLKTDIVESWDLYFQKLMDKDFQRGYTYMLFEEEDLMAMAGISLEILISNLLIMIRDDDDNEKHTH